MSILCLSKRWQLRRQVESMIFVVLITKYNNSLQQLMDFLWMPVESKLVPSGFLKCTLNRGFFRRHSYTLTWKLRLVPFPISLRDFVLGKMIQTWAVPLGRDTEPA